MTTELTALQARANAALASALGERASAYSANAAPLLETLFAASDYALNGGGKRVRPALVYCAAAAVDELALSHPALDAVACAVEMIHAYSLVHDDLPAMDDDDLRRGRPTLHKQFDEATAILVGDALQTSAFELLTQAPDLNAETRMQLLATLAAASGLRGMVGGQMIDIAAAGSDIDVEHLQSMHALKTGALIRASVALGAQIAGADDAKLSCLDRFADSIGLAFQVCDDVLDATASSDELGKTAGADAALNKPTYVSLLGLEAAREKADALLQEALSELAGFGSGADGLRELAHFIVQRHN